MARRLDCPKNDRVAMVQCPKWSNLPPIALAYIKGAVRRRSVQCFDLNHELLKQSFPDYRERFEFGEACRDIVAFMFRTPDFNAFEEICRGLARKYASILDQWVERLKDFGVVGFSLYQENLTMSTVLARRLGREHGVICVAGGPSMNMDGHVFLNRLVGDGTFDVAVLGIAEDVIDELLERIVTRGDLAALPGLALRGPGGEVVLTATKRPDLSQLCPPDYSDFDLEDYHRARAEWMSLYAVVGCVGNCEFCTIHEFYPGHHHKPVENLQQEMLELNRRHGKTQFFLSDGMFLGKREAALALFDFAIEHQFKLAIQIRLMPYWDDEELVRKASQCLIFLQVGFESASVNVRRAMRKMIDQERTMRIYRLFYKHRLPVSNNVIVGYPNETDADFNDTYHFLEEYLTAPERAVGTNVFYIPNGFPGEKYNVRTDALGHWASDQVNFYDRLSRMVRLQGLANRMGRPHCGYFCSEVEGVPMDSLSPSPQELSTLKVDRYVEVPDSVVGCLERAVATESYIQVHGWAKLPGRNQAMPMILLGDGQGKIVARAAIHDERPAAESSRRANWLCVFRQDALQAPLEKLCAYLYDPQERTAWQLADSRPVEQSDDESVVQGPAEHGHLLHAPHALIRRLRAATARRVRALPGCSALIDGIRALRPKARSADIFVKNFRSLGEMTRAADLEGVFVAEDVSAGEVDRCVSETFRAKARQRVEAYQPTHHLECLFRTAFEKSRFRRFGEPLQILDISPGAGDSVMALLTLFPQAKVIAADPSVESLALLKQLLASQGMADRCKLVQMGPERPDFADGSFDLVAGLAVLHRLFRPDLAIAACGRILRKGGLAVFFEPFELGFAMMRMLYQQILGDPRANEIDAQVRKFLQDLVADVDRRVGEDKSDPIYKQVGEKWVFTTHYLREHGLRKGFKSCTTYSLQSGERDFEEKLASLLSLGIQRTRDALPEWAWEMARAHDRRLSVGGHGDCIYEGGVLLQK